MKRSTKILAFAVTACLLLATLAVSVFALSTRLDFGFTGVYADTKHDFEAYSAGSTYFDSDTTIKPSGGNIWPNSSFNDDTDIVVKEETVNGVSNKYVEIKAKDGFTAIPSNQGSACWTFNKSRTIKDASYDREYLVVEFDIRATQYVTTDANGVKHLYDSLDEITDETERASAKLSYPEGLYFFNYFITPRIFSAFFSPLSELENKWLANNEPWEKSFATLACAADYETIYKNAIRFVLIPETADNRGGYPEKVWRPIPTEIGKAAKSFDIRTGVVPSGKRCSVIVGFDGGAENFSAKINGVALSDFEETDPSFIEGIGYQPKLSQKTVFYRAKFDESLLTSLTQKVEVAAESGAPTLSWVEINVD